MGYVQASTENPLGFRPWQSRLGSYQAASFVLPTTSLSRPRAGMGNYFHSGFPLPTTDLSRPINLGTVQFSNRASFIGSRDGVAREGYSAPIPRIYGPPELSPSRTGQRVRMRPFAFQPPGPPPRSNGTPVDMLRVDPKTGKYVNSTGDLLPRGVWSQVMFQHPAPAVSALGDGIPATGTVQVQLPGGQTVTLNTSPTTSDTDTVTQKVSGWMDQTMIGAIPNKYLVIGAAAWLLLRGRK